VGFRWFAREQARAFDLTGWVRNEPGGQVLLEVGGAAHAVSQFVELVQSGPPGARVDAIHEEPAEATPEALPKPFAVLR
jgi:acylphosphatase